MHRFALVVAVWSGLLLTASALAMLARPEAGPPMPRASASRASIGALVPEKEVVRDPRRDPHPDELSGTVAPGGGERPSTTPAAVPPAQPAVAPTEPSSERPTARPTREEARARNDGSIPGLGVLPPGVPAEDEGFGLHVVGADGKPLHDATVRWMLRRDLEALRAQGIDPDALDPADVLATASHTVRSNALGFAMLSSEAGAMLIDARLGDQYGWLRVRREDAGHARLVLAPDTTLDVLVVDAAGAPRSGVPVVLRDARCATIWSARSGDDGHARLRHADGTVRAARAQHDALDVAIDAPNGEARTLAFARIPDEPVRFAAPPGRSVRVEVRGVDGRPCPRATVVRLAPRGRESDCAASRERVAREGIAVFDDVPGGLDLVAVADSACSPESLRADVATRSDADSSVVLAARHAMPRVGGRLIDPRGNPWRGLEVVAHLESGASWLAQGSTRCDDRGAFELDVPGLHAAAGAPIAITLVARNDYGRTAASARIELAPPTGAPNVDLGDVTATDWPVLVRGTVVDEADRALEGAQVELCDADGLADPRTRTATDERGQFALRGPPPPDEALLVRALEPERRAADATVALRRGEWRAKIAIAIHGRLAGSVRTPDGAPEQSVIVRVDQPSGAQLALGTDDQGAFAFSNVEAGDARVSFLAQGFEEPLLVLEHVAIPRGGACVDPRIAAVDLRDELVVVDLEIVDERGVAPATASVGSVGEGRPHGRAIELIEGVARVVVPKDAVAYVIVDGYEPVAISKPAAGRVRVELVPRGG